MGVAIVDVVRFAGGLFPLIFVGREEGVGLGWGIVDLFQAEAIGQGQGLLVNAGTTDDIHILVGGAMSQGLV